MTEKCSWSQIQAREQRYQEKALKASLKLAKNIVNGSALGSDLERGKLIEKQKDLRVKIRH